AIEHDFEPVLRDKNALVSLRQVIRELEESQVALGSPIVLNGSPYGFFANHSLVMANYVGRANAALFDLRKLLERGCSHTESSSSRGRVRGDARCGARPFSSPSPPGTVFVLQVRPEPNSQRVACWPVGVGQGDRDGATAIRTQGDTGPSPQPSPDGRGRPACCFDGKRETSLQISCCDASSSVE